MFINATKFENNDFVVFSWKCQLQFIDTRFSVNIHIFSFLVFAVVDLLSQRIYRFSCYDANVSGFD